MNEPIKVSVGKHSLDHNKIDYAVQELFEELVEVLKEADAQPQVAIEATGRLFGALCKQKLLPRKKVLEAVGAWYDGAKVSS